jgi:hypothetical protein
MINKKKPPVRRNKSLLRSRPKLSTTLNPSVDAALKLLAEREGVSISVLVERLVMQDSRIRSIIAQIDRPVSLGIKGIAAVCHEAWRQQQRLSNKSIDPPWGELWDYQKEMPLACVNWLLKNHHAGAKQLHESVWVPLKERQGWTHGERSLEDKQSPWIGLTWEELPDEQRAAFELFVQLTRLLGGEKEDKDG